MPTHTYIHQHRYPYYMRGVYIVYLLELRLVVSSSMLTTAARFTMTKMQNFIDASGT